MQKKQQKKAMGCGWFLEVPILDFNFSLDKMPPFSYEKRKEKYA